jgi:hypothetical protein
MEQKLYNALCKFMELQIKDYVWYYDTPEQRFEHSPESIWLINPKKKEWILELEKSGKLWWYYVFHKSFHRYFNMELSDFNKFIKIWMEDVLNRGVSTTRFQDSITPSQMEDVLNRGVSTTDERFVRSRGQMEDVLNRGVSTTDYRALRWRNKMEDVLNRGTYIKDCME